MKPKMIKTEPIIAVHDVLKSSRWYCQLLNCKSDHGGDVYEILTDLEGNQILSLHKWGEHEHPTFTNPLNAGNGLILYFLVDDMQTIWDNAKRLEANIEGMPAINPNSGRMEFSLRDIDNYYISICSDSKKDIT